MVLVIFFKVNALNLLWLGNWQRWLWCATEINLTLEGISRVLLVTDGRFTEEEKKCDVDKRIMSEENEMIRCGDVIHG
ncbi:unnamed protein product [Rhizophagus irregularis]|uniref:Uncharacterized protein n=1 Tax=Rhizophagus irregularis TaxID=588596 RepID=A0A916E9E0_9GLOM|nr:unnamed protein product [Rhizophagus irregularis]